MAVRKRRVIRRRKAPVRRRRVVRRRRNPYAAVVNPRRRRAPVRRRKAPVRRRVARKRQVVRRRRPTIVYARPVKRRRVRSNPSMQFATHILAGGIGFLAADALSGYIKKMTNSASPWVPIMVKAAGAFAAWKYGSKMVSLPLARAFATGIGASAVVDLIAKIRGPGGVLAPLAYAPSPAMGYQGNYGLLSTQESNHLGALVTGNGANSEVYF